MKKSKHGYVVHTRGQKVAGWIALIMLFVCGMMVGVAINKKQVEDVIDFDDSMTNTDWPKITEDGILLTDDMSEYTQKALFKSIGGVEDCIFSEECYEMHNRNSVIFKRMSEMVLGDLAIKYQDMAKKEQAIADVFKEISGIKRLEDELREEKNIATDKLRECEFSLGNSKQDIHQLQNENKRLISDNQALQAEIESIRRK